LFIVYSFHFSFNPYFLINRFWGQAIELDWFLSSLEADLWDSRVALSSLKKQLKERGSCYVCSCSMLAPINYWSRMDKKGFCEDILTKQAHSGQEKLTVFGQETLTNIFCLSLSSLALLEIARN